MSTPVDFYFTELKIWKKELEYLRKIIIAKNLIETFKWKIPCYTFQNKNVLAINPFKEYFAISFFKGSLLKDYHKILIQQTENSQSTRQIRFTSIHEINKIENIINEYIDEAITIENSGEKINFKKISEYNFPDEFQQKINNDPKLKIAFESLTKGRQKEYILFFSSAKQSVTRESRIEKSISKILNKQGLTDCTCGYSKRMPKCDGSHSKIN